MGTFAKAGRWGPEAFLSPTGAARRGYWVYVYDQGTSNLATLYTDESKAATDDNPFQIDADGNGSFYAEPGEYDVKVSRTQGGAVLLATEVTVPPDPFAAATLEEWAAAESYELTAASYTDGVMTSATVKWPDGSAGTLTVTSDDGTYINAYTISHTDSGLTVTQAAVTRNGSGDITVKPALTVA